MTTPTFESRVLQSMSACPRCRKLSHTERDAHRRRAVSEAEQMQARTLTPLPANVWPDGRPPRGSAHGHHRKERQA